MDDINILNKEIDLLKNNIQCIMDSIKEKNENSLEINYLINKKEEYLKNLDIAIVKLKTITINKNVYKQVCKKTDNTIYRGKNIKENREKAEEYFDKINNIKLVYETLENEKLENEEIKLYGYIFFSNIIINAYKLCPYIVINENTIINRKNWLQSQIDNGKTFYDFYDKIIMKLDYIQLVNNKKDIENYFFNKHNLILNNEQKKILETTELYIQEYIQSSIKTKKIKAKFNIIINNNSNLVNETGFKINEFLSIYYDKYIPINEIENTDNLYKFDILEYNDKLVDYKIIINNIVIMDKYIKNTIKNLQQELYDYLYKQSNLNYNQIGKYFKKWSVLSLDEKTERFESYAEYIVYKYLIESNIINTDEYSKIIDDLKLLLKNNINNIKYKNIKWNIQLGIIENINCVKYDNIKHIFFMIMPKEKETIQVKKISSIRTIFNKDSDKIINEELMIYLINNKKQQKLKEEFIKDLKIQFIEQIKIKLLVKRLSVNDNLEIIKKFDNMYNIIYNNNNTL